MFKIIIAVLLGSFLQLKAQKSEEILKVVKFKIDSLKTQKVTFGRDTLLIKLLDEKCVIELNNSSNIDFASKSCQEALEISQKNNWRKGLLMAWHRKTDIENIKSRYFSVLYYSLKLISFTDKEKEWDYYLSGLMSAGSASIWLEKPNDALNYFNDFFKIYALKKSNFQKSNNYIVSKYTFTDANICMGILFVKHKSDYILSNEYFEKANQECKKNKDIHGTAFMNSWRGLTYEKLNDQKNAEKAFASSIKYFRENKIDYLLADALNNASEYYFRKGDFKKSKEYAIEALKLAKKVGIFYSLRDANKNLFKVYEAKNDYKVAHFYHVQYSTMLDSMSEASYDDKTKVIKYEFENEKNLEVIKRKIAENKSKNIMIYSLIIGLILSLFGAIIFYRNLNYRKKLTEKENLQLKQQQQLTATTSILKGQEEERGRLARDLHDGLGGLLSGIKLNLNNMNGNVILSEQNANVFQRAIGQLDEAIVEMRRVAHSMMPEALLKFGLIDAIKDFSENINLSGKLKIHFQTVGLSQDRFPENIEITLYRIVQELINNTLKHAEASDLYIQLAKTDDLLTLTAEDNGKGFDINTIKDGIGLKNIKNRVDYLGGKLDIRSKIGEGTSFFIEIKT